jgi:hypothetical protein
LRVTVSQLRSIGQRGEVRIAEELKGRREEGHI